MTGRLRLPATGERCSHHMNTSGCKRPALGTYRALHLMAAYSIRPEIAAAVAGMAFGGDQ